jgi:hypothetical protein
MLENGLNVNAVKNNYYHKIMFLLLPLFFYIHAWTIEFTEQACTNGFFLESEYEIDTFTKPATATCIPGGGIKFNECSSLQSGSNFIINPFNMNLSFEIEFSVPHPIPSVLGIMSLSIQDPIKGLQIMDFFMGYDYDLDPNSTEAILRSPHYFAIRTSGIITRTGYCDRIITTSNFIPFMTNTYKTIFNNIITSETSETTNYYAKIMIFGSPDDSTIPFLAVTISDGLTSGVTYSISNLGFGGASLHKYTVGYQNSGINYEIGCMNNSYPGIVLRRIAINQKIILPF